MTICGFSLILIATFSTSFSFMLQCMVFIPCLFVDRSGKLVLGLGLCLLWFVGIFYFKTPLDLFVFLGGLGNHETLVREF